MNKCIQKNIIIAISFFSFYVLFFDRIGVNFTNSCTIIGVMLVFYLAILLENFYKFFVGDKFNIGIRMYDIKGIKESCNSKTNLIHRRIGAFFLVCLFLICIFIIFIRKPCVMV
jgi:hypothetical protein